METFLNLSGTAWTGIYTLLTGGLLGVAIMAAWYAKRQWDVARNQIEESQRADREATRPYVIVTIEPGPTSRSFFDLSVKNIGRRPAFEVCISLEPAPVRAKEVSGVEIANVKMLNEPIAMIAPGGEMRTFYDSHIERANAKDLPTEHHVSLTYRDSSGHEYDEASLLDIDALKGTMYSDEKTIHHVAKNLEEVKKILKSAQVLARHGGLTVDAITESRADNVARSEREEYENLKKHLDLVRQATPDSESISGLERRIADYEESLSLETNREP